MLAAYALALLLEMLLALLDLDNPSSPKFAPGLTPATPAPPIRASAPAFGGSRDSMSCRRAGHGNVPQASRVRLVSLGQGNGPIDMSLYGSGLGVESPYKSTSAREEASTGLGHT